MPKKHSPEFRDRAVRMVYDRQALEGGPRSQSIRAVAPQLGVGTETLRIWCNRYGPGKLPASSTESLADENRRLRRGAGRFPAGERDFKGRVRVFRQGARPPHDEMIAFIDRHRDQFGVEAICRTLSVAERGFLTSRGYRAAKTRPASARSLRDEALSHEVRRLHTENYGVYGHRKMWHSMRRAGWAIGRDQTARLMRSAGLTGVRRGRKATTTTPARTPDQRPDLVNRNFTASAPNRLWVADTMSVRIPTGFAWTAFITDVCTRKIVGWATAANLHTEALPLQALEQALLSTGTTTTPEGLVHHSDRGSNYVSLAYTDALITAGVKASVGSVGDSYDNALAETINGLYKAELIHQRRIWPSVTAVEIATLEWVHWWNTARLHQGLGYRTPAEVEASYTRTMTAPPAVV